MGTEKHIWKVCGLEVSRKGVPPPRAARKHGSSCIRRWFYLLSNAKYLSFHLPRPLLSIPSKEAVVQCSENIPRSSDSSLSASSPPARDRRAAPGRAVLPGSAAVPSEPHLSSRPVLSKGIWTWMRNYTCKVHRVGVLFFSVSLASLRWEASKQKIDFEGQLRCFNNNAFFTCYNLVKQGQKRQMSTIVLHLTKLAILLRKEGEGGEGKISNPYIFKKTYNELPGDRHV